MIEGVGGKPVEVDQEAKNVFTLATLVSKLNDLTRKRFR